MWSAAAFQPRPLLLLLHTRTKTVRLRGAGEKQHVRSLVHSFLFAIILKRNIVKRRRRWEGAWICVVVANIEITYEQRCIVYFPSICIVSTSGPSASPTSQSHHKRASESSRWVGRYLRWQMGQRVHSSPDSSVPVWVPKSAARDSNSGILRCLAFSYQRHRHHVHRVVK